MMYLSVSPSWRRQQQWWWSRRRWFLSMSSIAVFLFSIGVKVHGFVPPYVPTKTQSVLTTSSFVPKSHPPTFGRISTTTLFDSDQFQRVPIIPPSPPGGGAMIPKQNSSTTTNTPSSIPFLRFLSDWKNRIMNVLKRPGMRFRLRLGLLGSIAWYLASVVLPPNQNPTVLLSQWMSQRGFQGLAALGRSIAYGWAVLIAYPRWLDKKAMEKQQSILTIKLESKKKYLKSLAQEVVMLRSHIYSLESEIRSFRRDILTMRAQGYVDPEIQDAITDEMAYLIELKRDSQQALANVKRAWSEIRSQNTLTWDEEEYEPMTLGSFASFGGSGVSSGGIGNEWMLNESPSGSRTTPSGGGGALTRFTETGKSPNKSSTNSSSSN